MTGYTKVQPQRHLDRLWLWMLPLILLITLLGSHGMSTRTITYDEYFTLYDSGAAQYGPLSPIGIWDRLAQDDPVQTPGYPWAIAAWGYFTGWSDMSLRWLSLLAGLLAVAFTYKLGREAVSPLAGLTAAMTFGLSLFFTVFLREMRTYTFYMLFTVITVWGYWRLVGQQKPKRGTMGLFFFGVLGLFYTHYFAVFTAVIISLYHLVFVKKDRRWLIPVALMGSAFILFIPQLLIFLNPSWMHLANPSWRRGFSMDSATMTQTVLYLFSNGSIALLGLIALNSLRVRTRFTGLIWFWAVMFMGITTIANMAAGAVAGPRYLFAMWPALALLCGLGVDRLAKDGLRPALIFAVWIAAALFTTGDPSYARIFEQSWSRLDWPTFAKTLAPHVVSTDKVVFLLPTPADYAMHRYTMAHYTYGLPGEYLLMEPPRMLGNGYLQQANKYTQPKQRLWVGYSPSEDTDVGAFDHSLINNHILCGEYVYTQTMRVRVYAPLPDATTPALTFDASKVGGGSIKLNLLVGPPDVLPQKRLVLMVLPTPTPDIPPNTYSISLQVQDAGGQIVAQKDFGVSDACTNNEIELNTLSAGTYTLKAAIYNWQTGQRLPAQNGTTGEIGDLLMLKSFQVQ